MTRHVHVNRSREPELTVLQHDRVLVLRDAIDRAVEGPIEDDARGLAAHPGIVLVEQHGKLLGALLPFRRQLRALNHARTAATGAPRSADPPFARLEVAGGAQRHERAATATRIGHDELFRRPVTCDVGLTSRTTWCTLRSDGCNGGRCAL